LIAKTNGERLAVIEEQITWLRKDVETLQKSINGIGVRFEEARKANEHRMWAVLTPVLAALITGILALIFGAKI